MKTSEIKTEAKNILNTIFTKVLESENKEDWKKAITFIDSRIKTLEEGERGQEMFVWRSVKAKLTFHFGKKFISK